MSDIIDREQPQFATAEPFHRSPEHFRHSWLRREAGNVVALIGGVLVHAAERLYGEPVETLPLGDQMVAAIDQEEESAHGR